ncbi:uncharacterized protein LOC110178304 isoform X2 [Drosophila serrata]|uniref:uncharacterized protein LOC110178304 isoform X2 n=1 Tax=Drosophila serrata TaxID=7274 RepID=UPI000A1D09E6|nr:uncharacterized protein LOC110178304 isoform X2 [Drosophila serrata]
MAALLTTYDSGDRIWSGSKRTFTYTDETSIGKIIFTNMKNWPNNVSQINDEDGGTVTFNEAITWAIRVAQIFKKKGFQYPDVIGLPVRNSTYVMSVAVACYLNGTPFHAINPVMDEATMTHVFSITKPKIIFCDGQDYEKVQAASKEWQPDILTVTDPIKGVPHIQSLLDPTPTEAFYQPEPLKEGSQQTMAILCSSGTTGLPKAVCISNRSLQHDFPWWSRLEQRPDHFSHGNGHWLHPHHNPKSLFSRLLCEARGEVQDQLCHFGASPYVSPDQLSRSIERSHGLTSVHNLYRRIHLYDHTEKSSGAL